MSKSQADNTAVDSPKEYYYRFDDYLVSAGVDEWDNPLGPPSVVVYKSKFSVLHRTPKGAWISYATRRRFVLDGARKKFACGTVEEARESFRARKKRQIKILQRKIDNAKKALDYLADMEVERGV